MQAKTKSVLVELIAKAKFARDAVNAPLIAELTSLFASLDLEKYTAAFVEAQLWLNILAKEKSLLDRLISQVLLALFLAIFI